MAKSFGFCWAECWSEVKPINSWMCGFWYESPLFFGIFFVGFVPKLPNRGGSAFVCFGGFELEKATSPQISIFNGDDAIFGFH